MHKRAMVIVAHPDDETLWAGGLMLSRRDLRWHVLSVCRASDPDRAPLFHKALEAYAVTGEMADLDDGPEQTPLDPTELERVITAAVGNEEYDLLVSHGLHGEYTHHKRHEEVHEAVAALWRTGVIRAREMWFFAYSDSARRTLPLALREAHFKLPLTRRIWEEKYRIVTRIYGFDPESWEARTTPQWEGFWCFRRFEQYERWKRKELCKL